MPVVSTVTWTNSGSLMPASREGPAGAVDRGLGLQQVLRGLDEHRVGAADDHAVDLGLVGVAQRGVPDVAEGRELRARPDRADHPARLVRRRPAVRDLPGEPGAGLGERVDPVLDAVLRQVGQVGAEGVGLDEVAADREVGVVDGADHVGPGVVEDLVAALVALEVVEREVGRLEHRAHRAVRDQDPLPQRLEQGGGFRALGKRSTWSIRV